jgi:hypothetical protein
MALIFLLPAVTVAASNDFGLGIILGEPTGLSGKLWLTRSTAVDGAVAWSFSDEDALHLHADFLVHNLGLIAVEKGLLAVHFGIGGRLKLEDDSRFGARIPVGLTYLFENAPLDVFFEIVPILDLVPDTEFNPNAAVGIRYFFGTSNQNQGSRPRQSP